jgi:MoaA/NifB/PqqE/SkfB family radical SAM enzyme
MDVASLEGILRPCTYFQDCARGGEGPLRIADTTAQKALESKAFENWRTDALAGRWVKGCTSCYLMERIGARSDRILYNQAYQYYHDGVDPRTVYQMPQTTELGAKAPSVEAMSLHLGNTCNLRCRICRPAASSLISADRIHRSWAEFDDPDVQWAHGKPVHDWVEDERILFGCVLHQLDSLEWLQLSGGEPLIIPPLWSILSHLLKQGAASRLSLAICTNGTRPNEKLLDMLTHFKHVRVRISVDGIDGVNEYIRFPSVWANIEETVKKWRILSNTSVVVAFTLSAYNVFEPARVAAWTIANGTKFEFGFVQKPRYMAANVLPSEVLTKASDQADQESEKMNGCPAAHEVKTIARHLRFMADHPCPDQFFSFIEFTNDLDRNRRQNIAKAQPELVSALQASGIRWDKHRRRFSRPFYEATHSASCLLQRVCRWLVS